MSGERKMKIRMANEEDIVESLKIAKILHEWFTPGATKKMQRNFKMNLLVALDKKVIGFLNYRINRKSIRILWMGVDKNLRRKGIGKKLINELEKIAIKKKIKKLNVSTLTYKDSYKPYVPTRNFYLGNGFVYKYIMKAKKKGHDDEVMMEKTL